MEPSALVLFAIFWIVSLMMRSAGQKGRKDTRRQWPAGPRPAGEWPQMPEQPAQPARPVAGLPPLESEVFPPAVVREPIAPAPVGGARMDAAQAKGARARAPRAEAARPVDDTAPVAGALLEVADMLDPGTMMAGIVLSEVLGPPKGRRPRGFSRIPLRNRL